MKRAYAVTAAVLMLWATGTSYSAAQAPNVVTRDVITDLDTPWEILWGPDGWIWMTERAGRVSRVDPTTGERLTIATIGDVAESGESGMLGMALHPSFADTPHVYIVYNYRIGGNIAEKLVRYRYDGTALVEPQILLENIPGLSTHDGSRLLVTPDRKLLMTTGDAQNQPAAQSHTSIVGKILRMNLDGSPAADNPFAGAAYPANYIWTTGHRNPQGLTIGPGGRIYSSEHGPDTDDEINIITASRNYGWPRVHGFCDLPTETAFCTDSSVVEPIKAWTPTIAVAGVEYYNHSAIPEFQNALLLTNLAQADFRVLTLNGDGSQIVSEQILFDNLYGRLRDVAIAPDGRVFIATSNRDGRGRPPTFPKADDDRIVEISSGNTSGATIGVPRVTPATLQGGEQIAIEFTATGAFTANNVFTAQLSDASGSFASPRVLGTLEGSNGGIITTTLPCDVSAGTGYRVRVVASSPAVTSQDNGANVVVSPGTQPVVTPSEPIAICAGASVQLGATGGTGVRWLPASGLSCTECDNPVASPAQTTSYVVMATNTLGCVVMDTITVTVNSLPVPTVTVIEQRTLEAPEGFVAYQWLRDQQPIPGANARQHLATANGSYAVGVIDANGCSGVSAPVQVTNVGIAGGDAHERALVVSPHPASDRLTIELTARRTAPARVELVDMRGATVGALDLDPNGPTLRSTIDIGDLAPGAYVLRIRSGDREWVRTIVKE